MTAQLEISQKSQNLCKVQFMNKQEIRNQNWVTEQYLCVNLLTIFSFLSFVVQSTTGTRVLLTSSIKTICNYFYDRCYKLLMLKDSLLFLKVSKVNQGWTILVYLFSIWVFFHWHWQFMAQVGASLFLSTTSIRSWTFIY